jgi:hypothetical protein
MRFRDVDGARHLAVDIRLNPARNRNSFRGKSCARRGKNYGWTQSGSRYQKPEETEKWRSEMEAKAFNAETAKKRREGKVGRVKILSKMKDFFL